MRLACSLSLVAGASLFACGGDDGPPAGADAGADAAVVNTVDGCATDALDRCDYTPATPYSAAPPMNVDLEYEDVTGATRAFQVVVRAPVGAPEPLPIVVWSHGGADGVTNPINAGKEWAAIFVAAGYLVVDIGHAPREPASRAALCQQLGIDVSGCPTFKYLHWDRPHDVRRVIDFLEAQAASGPFAGRLDPDRIVHAGHSAGAGAVQMVNGAVRDMGGPRTLADPRPIAFLANSPEGPGDDGYTETSYGGMTRPMLINTGAGDDTNVLGEDRARVFDLAPAGDKYRLFLLPEAARHGTFDQSPDACEDYSINRGLDPARCAEYERWLASAALAFLDAHARDSAAARAYLASDNLAVLAGGAATWSSK